MPSKSTSIAVLRAQIKALEKQVTLEWAGHDKLHALETKTREDTKADMSVRLEGLNDVRVRFLSREEYFSAHKALEDSIASLARLVYVGLGIVMLAGLVIGWLIQRKT